MSEKVTQAVIRFARVLVVGAIGAGVANVTILSSIVDDPIYATGITSVVLAALEFLSKLVGGPTTPAPDVTGIRGFSGSPAAKVDRPNILAV